MGTREMTGNIGTIAATAAGGCKPVAASGFDRIRSELRRPDLDDGALQACIAEMLECSSHLAAADRDRIADRLLRGAEDDALRRGALASLCLPAPSAPMAMPVQSLQRPPLFARLIPRLFGRLRQG